MKRVIFVVLVCLCGAASADPAAPTATPPAVQQQCRDALNADPEFAKQIADKLGIKIEQATIDAHEDANRHIQKNEAHVIYAYAAMWVIAALFVAYLVLRQQALRREIAALRRDLEAAGKDAA